MAHSTPGRLVTVSGFDGVGKSTQVETLVRRIAASGQAVSTTRQPTTEYRRLPVVREHTENGGNTERARRLAVLAAADRYRHVAEVLLPRLEAGEVVVCDRYVQDFFAVFAQRGVPESLLVELSVGLPRPDIAVYLRADLPTVLSRLDTRSGARRRHEERDAASVARVLAAYESVAHLMTAVDAARPVAQVADEVWRLVSSS